MTGQSMVDAVTGDHSTDSHLGLLVFLCGRLVQLHLQAELSTGNAAQVSRSAAQAERQRKAQVNCTVSFMWICEVSSGASTVHVDS